MPSLLIHLALGAILVAVVYRHKLAWWTVILLLIAAVFPDLDALAVHRGTLHNIFLPAGLAIGYLVVRKKNLLDSNRLRIYAMCILLISLHIVFDVFYSSVFLFYPITGEGIHLGFWLGATDTGLLFEMEPLIEGTTQAFSGTVTTLVYVVTPSPGVDIPIIESGFDFALIAFGGLMLGRRMWRERLEVQNGTRGKPGEAEASARGGDDEPVRRRSR